jgi:hypothetical protein
MPWSVPLFKSWRPGSRQGPKAATKIRFCRQSVSYIDYTGQPQCCPLAAFLRARIGMCRGRSVTPSRLRQMPTCGRFQNSHLTHENCYVGKLHSGRQHRSLHWNWRFWLMVPRTSDIFNTLISFLIIINDGDTVMTWFFRRIKPTHSLHCIPETPKHCNIRFTVIISTSWIPLITGEHLHCNAVTSSSFYTYTHNGVCKRKILSSCLRNFCFLATYSHALTCCMDVLWHIPTKQELRSQE